MPCSKYSDLDKARLAYARKRKPKKSATVELRRRLHSLLVKLLGQWDTLYRQYVPVISLSTELEKRIMATRGVCRRQGDLIEGKDVSHRIVSIDRPYRRP